MIILITGTPGTGKTSAAKSLSKMVKKDLICINDLEDIYSRVDEERGSKIVDMKRLENKLHELITGDVIIEGHLSHLLPFGDIIVVLRTHPKRLRERLEEKGFGKEKVQENLEAEALDVCLIEALERHKDVYEIDTTEKSPNETAEDITKIIDGEIEGFMPGNLDWSEEFF